MPLIKVPRESEAKIFRTLLETRQPIQSIAPADEHLYVVNSYQLEILKQLGLPFQEIQQDGTSRRSIRDLSSTSV